MYRLCDRGGLFFLVRSSVQTVRAETAPWCLACSKHPMSAATTTRLIFCVRIAFLCDNQACGNARTRSTPSNVVDRTFPVISCAERLTHLYLLHHGSAHWAEILSLSGKRRSVFLSPWQLNLAMGPNALRDSRGPTWLWVLTSYWEGK